MNPSEFAFLENKIKNKTIIYNDLFNKKSASVKLSNCGGFAPTTNPTIAIDNPNSIIYYNDEIWIFDGANQRVSIFNIDSMTCRSGVAIPNKMPGLKVTILNDEIHILSATSDQYTKYHYVFRDNKWAIQPSIPISSTYFGPGCVVTLNDKIHLLGGMPGNTATYLTVHYTFDGTSWDTSPADIPYAMAYGDAVVLNGEIHLMGGVSGNNTSNNYMSPFKHYKYNENNGWTEVSTLPIPFVRGSASVYNNEIHILGSDNTKHSHYKFDGETWIRQLDPPLPTLWYGLTEVFDGYLWFFKKSLDSSYKFYLYKFDGEVWNGISKEDVFNFKEPTKDKVLIY